MDKKVKQINSTFEEWTNHVMKPKELSEARLFSVETRLSEEEDFRVKEMHSFREHLKKLVYAIE